MSECFYCEDGEKRKSLMIEICKLNYSTIYLNRNQKYPGRCVVKLNEHKTEYFYGYGTYSLWRFITADRNKGT